MLIEKLTLSTEGAKNWSESVFYHNGYTDRRAEYLTPAEIDALWHAGCKVSSNVTYINDDGKRACFLTWSMDGMVVAVIAPRKQKEVIA